MGLAEAIKERLQSSSEFMDLVAGAVFAASDVGRDGITRTGAPEAYDETTGYMLTSVLIIERSDTPWGGISDTDAQVISTRKMVEIYFYDDGDMGYNVIEQLRDLAYGLLHGRSVGGTRIKWDYDANDLRDEVLNNAALIRSDYAAVRVRAG